MFIFVVWNFWNNAWQAYLLDTRRGFCNSLVVSQVPLKIRTRSWHYTVCNKSVADPGERPGEPGPPLSLDQGRRKF